MRKISIDEKYMFTVEQGIENNSGSEISLRPYGLLRRHGEPKDMKNFFILHEGIIRMSDGELSEEDYGDIADLPILEKEGTLLDDDAYSRSVIVFQINNQIFCCARYLSSRSSNAFHSNR